MQIRYKHVDSYYLGLRKAATFRWHTGGNRDSQSRISPPSSVVPFQRGEAADRQPIYVCNCEKAYNPVSFATPYP